LLAIVTNVYRPSFFEDGCNSTVGVASLISFSYSQSVVLN